MKKIFLLGFIFLLAVSGCKNNSSVNDAVRIENKLHKNIVCILGYNYPDLTLNFIAGKANDNRFEIDSGKTIAIDTLGLCNKTTWDKYIKHNMLMLFVFDKNKLAPTGKPEDALLERYYFSYSQLMKLNGVITIE